MSDLGRQLADPPTDGITSLNFYEDSSMLLASSWDGTARVYETAEGALRGTFAAGAPLLDAAFENEGAVYTAGLNHAVKRYDFFSGQEVALGSHAAAVKCLRWLPTRGLLVSGGWDSTLRLWDPRVAPGPAGQQVAAVPLPGKVYSMDVSGERLVVAMSGRHVDVFDLRTLHAGQPEQRRESSLKFQTRCVRCYTDGAGYALGSVEGRVAMEWFDPSEAAQARKYAFKCHRKTEGGKDLVFPVNAIAFNRRFGTFVTGGGDGVVSFWDGENKKRLHQVPGYPTSVAAMAFNGAATQLAVAASYTFEQGEKEHPRDAIYIRDCSEAEVRPKARAAA
ncbi:mitotic checkpoint [Micractinium conductrix]|uniref:Mitotic checkpoint n=1 Tax=Micractinium conductrix TaxID=554055 RepID=A0A2P6VRC2_9CHLO|nr:mitotic checkpoint [Micractinium conductrix]|eukprot:PSC76632.1 mitotic checkpoint [Micractinium conductrix]